MQILVTGATGYVGGAAARALVHAGHRVSALTRDPAAERAAGLGNDGIRTVRGDLGDPDSLVAAIRTVDAVVHTAFDADDHVGTDRALFDALRTAAEDGSDRHLVYTTGCSVYGPNEHAVVTETTPVDPDNRRARLEAELRTTRIPHTILRPAMVHGGDARTSIVGRWFEAARSGRPVHHGRRDKRWSWVHVDDVAAGYVAVLRDPAAQAGRTYLLADQQPVAPLTVLQAAARTAGYDGAVSFAPIEDELATYRVFDHDEIVDAAQARTGQDRRGQDRGGLGWTPSRPDVLAELPASFAAWSRR